MSWERALLEHVGRLFIDFGRWVGGRLLVAYEWFRSRDPFRVSFGLVAVGSAVALFTVLLGGFLPTPGVALAGPLYVLAVLLPLGGIALAAYAVRLAARSWRRPGGDPLTPPLDGDPRVNDDGVASDVDDRLARAGDARYRCSSTRSAEAIRADLSEGAARVVQARHGLSPAAAREAVRTGEWTDDPIAAGFLGEAARLPFDERLRATVDPGRSYRRQVRRTVAAIEALDPAATPADATEGARGSSDADGADAVGETTGTAAEEVAA